MADTIIIGATTIVIILLVVEIVRIVSEKRY